MSKSVEPIGFADTLRGDLVDLLLGPGAMCRMTADEAAGLAMQIMALPVISALIDENIQRARRK